jgi:hypothetical protein
MEIKRALQIAERDWGNIRISLEKCGDIGEFLTQNHTSSKSDFLSISEGLLLVRNLIGMENKLPIYGYCTPEAGYVFVTLASKAGKRLELTCRLAETFGSGYSWVRTGWFDPNGIEEQKHVIKQLFFFKIFFPLGGYFNWDFNSPVVKTKLKAISYKFATWQDNPSGYLQDIRDYREQIEPLWRGLASALGFPVADSGREYQTWEEIESRT